MATTKIEWADVSWNPVTGCSKVSTGCDNCYARTMARRLQGMGHPRYRNGFDITCHEDALSEPAAWRYRKPRRVFVCSMGDLFHADVPFAFIERVFQTMAGTPKHRFMVLTKRPQRCVTFAASFTWPHNVWLGVSVETNSMVHRIRVLRDIPAHTRFVSFEPLIGPVPLFPTMGIHWVIVGGETGPSNALELNPVWARQIRDRCIARRIPFFFKSWGRVGGRLLDGVEWNQEPVDLEPGGLTRKELRRKAEDDL